MKKIFPLLIALLLTACSSMDKNYAAMLAANQSNNASMATVLQEQVRALAKGIESSDPTARAVSAMSLSMLRFQAQDVPRPPESDAYKWAALVMPAVTTLGMGYYTYRLGEAQSANQRDIALSTNSAFLGMGQAIGAAGVAGYPFIQAPGSTTTTTTTNTYTDSYNQTTTRNCNGGSGGNGGTGSPAGSGSAGGSATC